MLWPLRAWIHEGTVCVMHEDTYLTAQTVEALPPQICHFDPYKLMPSLNLHACLIITHESLRP